MTNLKLITWLTLFVQIGMLGIMIYTVFFPLEAIESKLEEISINRINYITSNGTLAGYQEVDNEGNIITVLGG